MTNLIGGLPAFLSERQVMYRERAASMYAVLPFGIATGVVEVPYLLTQALIFVPISYFMIGFSASAGPLLLYIVIFTESIALYTFMVRPCCRFCRPCINKDDARGAGSTAGHRQGHLARELPLALNTEGHMRTPAHAYPCTAAPTLRHRPPV